MRDGVEEQGVVSVDGEGPEFGRGAPGVPPEHIYLPPKFRQNPELREPDSPSVTSPSWCVAIATVLSDFLGQSSL